MTLSTIILGTIEETLNNDDKVSSIDYVTLMITFINVVFVIGFSLYQNYKNGLKSELNEKRMEVFHELSQIIRQENIDDIKDSLLKEYKEHGLLIGNKIGYLIIQLETAKSEEKSKLIIDISRQIVATYNILCVDFRLPPISYKYITTYNLNHFDKGISKWSNFLTNTRYFIIYRIFPSIRLIVATIILSILASIGICWLFLFADTVLTPFISVNICLNVLI